MYSIQRGCRFICTNYKTRKLIGNLIEFSRKDYYPVGVKPEFGGFVLTCNIQTIYQDSKITPVCKIQILDYNGELHHIDDIRIEEGTLKIKELSESIIFKLAHNISGDGGGE